MYIPRLIESKITKQLSSNKVITILGARRVGKTVLVEKIYNSFEGKKMMLNGEDLDTHDLIGSLRKSSYDLWAKELNLLLIDEAQAIPHIGKSLKLLIDSYNSLTIIATGSSAFSLNNEMGEPLVGRQYIHYLHAISQQELNKIANFTEVKFSLPQRLIYGNYPDVVLAENSTDKERFLLHLVESYLLKDILIFEQVKNAHKMLKLLKMLAFQVGSEVSYNELANSLQLDRNTIERYIDLFSKVFIIYKLSGFSKNLRKEVTKSVKWYFYDNGLRNALINDFRPIETRNDLGALWENYLVSERIKKNEYGETFVNHHFWRTYDQQEIDLLEIKNQTLRAFEFKWKKQQVKTPTAFKKAYPEATFEVINKDNYLAFIG